MNLRILNMKHIIYGMTAYKLRLWYVLWKSRVQVIPKPMTFCSVMTMDACQMVPLSISYIFYTSIGCFSLSILLFILIFMLQHAHPPFSICNPWLTQPLLSNWLLSTAWFSDWLSTVGPIIALWLAWSSAISWQLGVGPCLCYALFCE